MNKSIVALLLAAMSTGAMAEWVEVGSNEISTVYVDPATIRRSGDMAKLWSLIDLKSPQRNKGSAPFLSSKTQQEFHCKEERFRILYLSLHSGKMGNGDVVYSENVLDKWTPVPPESGAEGFWDVACGKTKLK